MTDQRLIANLRRFGTRQASGDYLDFVGDLFTRLELRGDDPRFHLNPVTTRFGLPLTINNRYVAALGRPAKDKPLEEASSWWLIHPGWAHLDEDIAGQVRGHFAFAHKRHDHPEGPPVMLRLSAGFVLSERERLLEGVLDVARRDLAACRSTPWRKSHSPDAYACALDDDERERWLRRAFPSTQLPDV